MAKVSKLSATHKKSKQHAPEQRKVNLSLQGGGSHGAYTWGVLDRLLEDERIIIEGVSGTSAGAMNAAVMVDGYERAGREGARTSLATFWKRVSEAGKFGPVQHAPMQKQLQQWNLDWSPAYTICDMMTRLFSPYVLNPLNINPLKDILNDLIDFDRLQKSDAMHLFIAATSVTTGQPRIFSHEEITADALMASACLPFMFQAVEIGDDYLWDGGYMGNPAIWPLTYHCETSDIIIVEINPVARHTKPTEGKDIINRLNEISFNSSLIAEVRAIHFVNRLIDDNHLSSEKYRKLHLHLIASTEQMTKLNASSKMNTSWEFLTYLHELGRAAADQWITDHLHQVGVESSVDVEEAFLAEVKHPHMRKRHETGKKAG